MLVVVLWRNYGRGDGVFEKMGRDEGDGILRNMLATVTAMAIIYTLACLPENIHDVK